MKRRPVLFIACQHVGAHLCDQERNGVEVALLHGQHERRSASHVPHIRQFGIEVNRGVVVGTRVERAV